jgi:diadenosine tetraphosphate (Ap4A) HIT family hydrolase
LDYRYAYIIKKEFAIFELNPKIILNHAIILENSPLSKLLLINDNNYPWFALVPRRENVTEIYQLSEADQQQFIRESSYLFKVLNQIYKPDKLNFSSYGNRVAQLHVHHVVRYEKDAT